MSALRDLSSTWRVNLVSLEATDHDEQHGVDTVMMYNEFWEALMTATTETDLVDFRNRRQFCDKLKNMLLALVCRGVNVYLGKVISQRGKGIAEMTLHRLCYVGTTAFAVDGLDGLWMGSQEADKLDSKRAKKDQVIAIKCRPRPKLVT